MAHDLGKREAKGHVDKCAVWRGDRVQDPNARGSHPKANADRQTDFLGERDLLERRQSRLRAEGKRFQEWLPNNNDRWPEQAGSAAKKGVGFFSNQNDVGKKGRGGGRPRGRTGLYM